MKSRIINLFLLSALAAALGLIPAGRVTAQTFTNLHSFTAVSGSTSTNSDGASPHSGLILSGNMLYGTAYVGGTSGRGAVFKVNADGTGFTNLHSFTGYPSEGSDPEAGLILSGNTLYGTTYYGGNQGFGTVFKVNSEGTGFTNLHQFTGVAVNGAFPYAGLVLSGNTLYGTTRSGGSPGNGMVFAVNTDGTGFTNLHTFTATPNLTNSDGAGPNGLVLSGDTLYGTAYRGGSANIGTVFKLNTSGTGFTTVHNFAGYPDDGRLPYGLILSGSTLYGTAKAGGNSDHGVVFKVNTDGTGYTNLYSFAGGSDGSYPEAGLILSGNALFGMANFGGFAGNGAVFMVSTDGTGFTNLYSFTAASGSPATNSDGTGSIGLILSSNTLYGTASAGGTSGNGTVFSLSFPSIPVNYMIATSASPSNGGMTSGNGTFIASSSRTVTATANSGYTFSNWTENGIVVSTSSSYTFTLNTNRTLVANFTQNITNNTITVSASPSAGGTVTGGGIFASGTSRTVTATANVGYSFTNWTENGSIVSSSGSYTFTVNGNRTLLANFVTNSASAMGYFVLHTFSAIPPLSNNNDDGARPYAGLVLFDSALYGTTTLGGGAGHGTIFKINIDGTDFIVLHSFAIADGVNSRGDLILSGSTLYGTASGGGSIGYGTIFKMNIDGTGFAVIHNFTGGSDGKNPDQAGLVLSGTTLYSTTYSGGSQTKGTVFKINTDGTGFAVLHNFTGGDDGAQPDASLTLSGNTLYGTTYGDSTDYARVFKLNSDGSGFTNLHIFRDSEHSTTRLVLSGTTLYGTASGINSGTIFKVNTDGTGFTNIYNFNRYDGEDPNTLGLSNNTLYGTTSGGGEGGHGTLFNVKVNGTGFTNLYYFTQFSVFPYTTNNDGAQPLSGLLLSGSTFYGTTYSGGGAGLGVAFAFGFQPVNQSSLTAHALRASHWNPASGQGVPGDVIISWLDTNSLLTTVETTTNLMIPHWTPYAGVLQHQGSNNWLAFLPQGPQRYFRLRLGSEQTNPPAVWHLVTNSAKPFEIVQLAGGSITTNEPVSVRFSDQGGFLVELPAQAKSSISVVAPYYVNPATFQLAPGNLSLEVVRRDGTVERVDGTLALAAPATVQSAPGRLTVAFLRGVEQMLADAGESSANKAANEATYLAVKQDCLAYRDEIKAFRTALESWMTNSATQAPISLGNLRTVNGLVPLQLDAATLAMNDRLLLSFASATLHGQTASSPADEENWVENFQKNIDYHSNEGLDTMRRVTGHLRTAFVVGGFVAAYVGAVPALGVAVGGTVVCSILTWIPVATTTALKVGTDTGDGSLEERLDPEKEIVWRHVVSTVVDTAVKWVQDGLDLTPVQSAGAKLVDRVIRFSSSLVNKFSNLILTRQTAPDGNLKYGDVVDVQNNQVFYQPSQLPSLSPTFFSFTGKGLTTVQPKKNFSIYRLPDYHTLLTTTNSWVHWRFLGTSPPDATGWVQDNYEIYLDLSRLVPGYPGEGFFLVHGPNRTLPISLTLADPTVSGTIIATWYKKVNGQLQQGTINGQLVGSIYSFSPLLNGPLLSDKTKCELDIDWDHSNVAIPAAISFDFGFAQPYELLYDLIAGTCTGTITGAGRFTGTADQNTFTAHWIYPITPSESVGIDGMFNFTVDPF